MKGFKFKTAKNPSDPDAMCFKDCNGPSGCFKVEAGCDASCVVCVKAQKCTDLKGRKRCKAFKKCRCDVGSLDLYPSMVGFKLGEAFDSDNSSTTPSLFTENGYPAFFKVTGKDLNAPHFNANLIIFQFSLKHAPRRDFRCSPATPVPSNVLDLSPAWMLFQAAIR